MSGTKRVKSRIVLSVSTGIFSLLIVTASWVFGVFDARRDATQALYLEVLLNKPTFVSRIRYGVHVFFWADANRRFIEFGGLTVLDVAVGKGNFYAIGKIAPLVQDDVFEAALKRACEADEHRVIEKLISSRNDLDLHNPQQPCGDRP